MFIRLLSVPTCLKKKNGFGLFFSAHPARVCKNVSSIVCPSPGDRVYERRTCLSDWFGWRSEWPRNRVYSECALDICGDEMQKGQARAQNRIAIEKENMSSQILDRIENWCLHIVTIWIIFSLHLTNCSMITSHYYNIYLTVY